MPICAGAIASLASPGAAEPSVVPSRSSGEPLTMRANSSVSVSDLIASNWREIATSALRSDGVFTMPTRRYPVRTCESPNISVAYTQARSTAFST